MRKVRMDYEAKGFRAPDRAVPLSAEKRVNSFKILWENMEVNFSRFVFEPRAHVSHLREGRLGSKEVRRLVGFV